MSLDRCSMFKSASALSTWQVSSGEKRADETSALPSATRAVTKPNFNGY
jgi:hypothetical protein